MVIVASRRGINQALQRKRSAWIFHPLDGCRLSLSELVVYSFRACQNEYQQQSPSRRQVARAVGMGRDAVARADRELMEARLLDCNLIPQEPPEGWFQKKKPDPGRHWRHGYTSWTKYVPRPDCRMSLLTICCWSYLAHCAQTGWTPKSGLGASYLCRVLRACRQSVQRVLETLRQSELIQRRDGSWCPVLVDLGWLADKWDGQKSAESSSQKVRWVELPEGATVTIPTADSTYAAPPAPKRSPNALCNELFIPLMMRPGVYTLEERQAMVRAILATPDWKKLSYDCYLEMSRAVESCKSGEEWLAVEGWLKTRGNGKA